MGSLWAHTGAIGCIVLIKNAVHTKMLERSNLLCNYNQSYGSVRSVLSGFAVYLSNSTKGTAPFCSVCTAHLSNI